MIVVNYNEELIEAHNTLNHNLDWVYDVMHHCQYRSWTVVGCNSVLWDVGSSIS